MPTIAVSTARGVATCFAGDNRAVAAARCLFGPIATLVWVEDDALINVATALSGSGAAYAYAFVRDLALAGARRGLSPDQALVLARLTVSGALSRLEGDTPVQTLIDEVASPGGTTEAGLWVLEPGLSSLLDATVEAALNRAGELSS
jgi:pyrroline-5-carboxylate reductase